MKQETGTASGFLQGGMQSSSGPGVFLARTIVLLHKALFQFQDHFAD